MIFKPYKNGIELLKPNDIDNEYFLLQVLKYNNPITIDVFDNSIPLDLYKFPIDKISHEDYINYFYKINIWVNGCLERCREDYMNLLGIIAYINNYYNIFGHNEKLSFEILKLN